MSARSTLTEHIVTQRFKDQTSVGTLYYFNIRGRGDICHMCAAHLGQNLYNSIITVDNGPDREALNLSPTKLCPFLKLPSGEYMPETKDICKYLATCPSPAGKTLICDHVQEAVFNIIDDPTIMYSKAYIGQSGDKANVHFLLSILPWEAVAKDMVQPWLSGTILPVIKMLEGKFSQPTGPFYSGEQPGFGDFAVFEVLDDIVSLQPSFKSEFGPRLTRMFDACAALPGVAEFLAARPTFGSGFGRVGSFFSLPRSHTLDAKEYVDNSDLSAVLKKAISKAIRERPDDVISHVGMSLTGGWAEGTYFIGHLSAKDEPNFMKMYASKVDDTLAAFGGAFIVRAMGDAIIKQEGDELGQEHVVIKFPTRKAALEWKESKAYKAILHARNDASTLRSVFVDALSWAGRQKGYFIGHFTINDGPTFASQYASKVDETIAPFGGNVIAQAGGGAVTEAEGSSLGDLHVVIEFPNANAALRWSISTDYTALKQSRDSASAMCSVYCNGI